MRGLFQAFAFVVMSTLTITAAAISPVAAPLAKAHLEGITEYGLENGLRVVLAPSDANPMVAFNLVYLTGSRDDREGEAGAAHMLEHMMFKGTTNQPGTRITSGMTQRGMQFNATTSYGRTRYQANFAADPAYLDWLLQMEADRMTNATLSPADLKSEIPVVEREMELAADNPLNMLTLRMMAMASGIRDYSHGPLGTRGDVEKLTAARLRAFYREHYRPENAVLILSGKFDPARTLERIQAYFGPISATGPSSGAPLTREPRHEGPRQAEPQQGGDTPWLAAMYTIPPATHPDTAALDALSNILADPSHGRLHQSLVATGKAAAIAANRLSLSDTGIFLIAAALRPKQPADAARTALIETLESLNRNLVTAEELARAKLAARNQRMQLQADPAALGDVLAEGAAVGDWRLFFINDDRIAALTVAQVQQAAEHYLRAGSRTVGESMPASSPSRIAAVPVTASTVADTTAVDRKLGEQSDASDAGIDQLEAGIQRFALSNGLKVALLSKPVAGHRVHGRLKLRFGDEKSLFGKRQIADLTAAMLIRGTRTMSRQQIADRLASLGAQLTIVPDNDHVSVRFESSSDSLPALLDLLAEVLREPAFPASELEMLRNLLETGLTSQRNKPARLASEALTRHASPYPAGDVRREPGADEAIVGVRMVKREDLIRFHTGFYGADHGELALVGDFDPAAIRDRLESLLGHWNSAVAYARPPMPFHVAAPATLHVTAPGKPYGYYLARLRFPVRDEAPAATALLIANQIFGAAPLGSRLVERLRSKDGASYAASSRVSFSSFEERGSMTIAATYPVDHGEQLAAAVRDELDRFIRDGVSAAELQQAKEALLQQTHLALSRDAGILAMFPLQLRTGRTMRFVAQRNAAIAKTGIADVNAAIRQYIDPTKLVEVLADTRDR